MTDTSIDLSLETELTTEQPDAQTGTFFQELPAEERIENLLTAMRQHRPILLKILAACENSLPEEDVYALIKEAWTSRFAIYSPSDLCVQLEKAGALLKITEEGELVDDLDIEPEVVVENGVEYLKAPEPVKIYWLSTDEGMAAVAADKPLERFRALLEESPEYTPIYERVLSLCSDDQGATTSVLEKAIDDDPLVQEPRRYATFFVERLEKCDAVCWRSSWVTTDIGKACLDSLKA